MLEASDQIWCHATPVRIPTGIFEAHSEPRSLVRFVGPIQTTWKTALAGAGFTIEFWAPPFGACVTLPVGIDPSELRQFDFVAGEIAYSEERCRRAAPDPTDEHRRNAGLPDSLFDIVCFDKTVRPKVEDKLRELGVEIVDRSSSKLRVRYRGDLAILRDLPGVKLVDAARGAVVLEASGLAVALAAATSSSDWRTDLDGTGEIVAVADTGLDIGSDGSQMHRDFQGRIEFLTSWPTNSSWDATVTQPGHDDGPADLNTGHGTHVASLAVGDGASSMGVHRGVAPGARLVFQALEQFSYIRPEQQANIRAGYYLSGRPLDLRQLFQQARDRGARIHVNSWGDPAAGAYTSDCYEADLFLYENPDALILFAAGNDGADRDQDGRIDPGSLYAPASAKSVVAIGSTEGPLSNVGRRGSWALFDPQRQRFTTLSDRTDPISGEPDRIAPFSSTGPTADGRIKPDICVPGTNLAAARSQACQATGWGLADPLPFYMYDGGTSTATGVAGGFVALVRQAWRQAAGGKAPSGAALKAILILGATPVRGRSGFPLALPEEAGFGRANLARSSPSQTAAQVLLLGDDDPGLQTGDQRTYPLTVPQDATLRAVLCWYDFPGERLINDLDLDLLSPAGTTLKPASPDRANTVELLEVSALAAGTYTLRVNAFNIPEGPQRFALAVSIAN